MLDVHSVILHVRLKCIRARLEVATYNADTREAPADQQAQQVAHLHELVVQDCFRVIAGCLQKSLEALAWAIVDAVRLQSHTSRWGCLNGLGLQFLSIWTRLLAAATVCVPQAHRAYPAAGIFRCCAAPGPGNT
jgi:hypothetical protein